jgi:flavin reductase (DIM6/NTAB) family NADH-FMN oxidoreductase RutF
MITKEEFTKSMRHWASGVTIITYKDGDFFSGLTASSFSSVSVDPFLVLFCLNKSSAALNKIIAEKSFAVNILSMEQKDLSNSFASSQSDRAKLIKENGYTIQVTGTALLNSSISNLDCILYNTIDAGDHSVLIGKVEFAQTDESKKALLYYNRNYHSL